MAQIFLSIIIPAFNEQKNLGKHDLEAVLAYLHTQNFKSELILVDDGSTDDTLKFLQEFAAKHKLVRIIQNPHQGKALTVKTGMLAAEGEICLFTDLDQSTPITELDKLLPWVKNGYQVVIGSREIKGAKREAEPLHRHIMGKVFNLVVRTLAVPGISDTQCGFKLFTREATTKLFGQLQVTTAPKKDAFTGAFDVELLFLAKRAGYKIAEVPVIWHHIKSVRVNPVKDSVRMFAEVLKIRMADISGKYGSENI